MTSIDAPGAVVTLDLDERPSGEPYFRHPGDVVRLVVWGTVAVVVFVFLWQVECDERRRRV